MPQSHSTIEYSRQEERINIYSHGFGCILSVLALPFLLLRAQTHQSFVATFSFVIFGISLITLYAASTLYHAAKSPSRRYKLRVFDHSAIYILIAGSYTPFTLVTLQHTPVGAILFISTWLIAVTGIILKLFFTGRYEKLSTFMYLCLGWIGLFAVKPLLTSLPKPGLIWLLIGGLSYSFGAIIFSLRGIKYNHAIFHLFALLGSLSHFIAIYFYV